jgi:hypothetical protein
MDSLKAIERRIPSQQFVSIFKKYQENGGKHVFAFFKLNPQSLDNRNLTSNEDSGNNNEEYWVKLTLIDFFVEQFNPPVDLLPSDIRHLRSYENFSSGFAQIMGSSVDDPVEAVYAMKYYLDTGDSYISKLKLELGDQFNEKDEHYLGYPHYVGDMDLNVRIIGEFCFAEEENKYFWETIMREMISEDNSFEWYMTPESVFYFHLEPNDNLAKILSAQISIENGIDVIYDTIEQNISFIYKS